MRCGMISWCRFLRARKFDVPKAKAMLLSAEQWRKDEKVDELARCVIFLPVVLPCERCRLLNPILLFLGTERLNLRRRKR